MEELDNLRKQWEAGRKVVSESIDEEVAFVVVRDGAGRETELTYRFSSMNGWEFSRKKMVDPTIKEHLEEPVEVPSQPTVEEVIRLEAPKHSKLRKWFADLFRNPRI